MSLTWTSGPCYYFKNCINAYNIHRYIHPDTHTHRHTHTYIQIYTHAYTHTYHIEHMPSVYVYCVTLHVRPYVYFSLLNWQCLNMYLTKTRWYNFRSVRFRISRKSLSNCFVYVLVSSGTNGTVPDCLSVVHIILRTTLFDWV